MNKFKVGDYVDVCPPSNKFKYFGTGKIIGPYRRTDQRVTSWVVSFGDGHARNYAESYLRFKVKNQVTIEEENG